MFVTLYSMPSFIHPNRLHLRYSCCCTVDHLFVPWHGFLFNIPFLSQQLILTDTIYQRIMGNRVKRVPVRRYIMPILHLKSPWRFLRVRYIIILLGILLVFPFRPYWFVVPTFIFSNHPSDWQRGWFDRLTRAFVEARYALSSNELVLEYGDYFAVWDSSSWGCCWPHKQTTFFFALISSLPVSTVSLESNLGFCGMDIAYPRCDGAYRTIGEPVPICFMQSLRPV